MNRTEDDVRAVYVDPPGIDEAERRILASIGAELGPITERRRAPRRAWIAVAASAAAVVAVVTATVVVTHQGAPARPAAPAPIVPGPYRHVVIHTKQPDAVNSDMVDEVWTSADGHRWGTQTDQRRTHYWYGKDDLTSTRYTWSPGFLRSLPTDPQKLRQFLVAHADSSNYAADGHFVDPGGYVFGTVESFWKDEGYQYLSPAALAAIVHMLEATPRIETHQVRDPKGRSAVRLDWPIYDGTRHSLLFDPKTFAYLGSAYVGSGTSDQTVVEVDETTGIVPAKVAEEARKANRAAGTDYPWRPPKTG